MIAYPKIETLLERNELGFVDPTSLRYPAFGEVRRWVVTEKVDGMNIRIHLTADNQVQFGGRTDNAVLSANLANYLSDNFTPETLSSLRLDDSQYEITLFGEGYGAGIQKGGDYGPNQEFILFDVCVDNHIWLDEKAVTGIARKLGIKRVPLLGMHDLFEIITMIHDGFESNLTGKANPEGIVAKTAVPLYDNRHNRLMFKLKHKDFANA